MKKMPKSHYLSEIRKHFPDFEYKDSRIIRHGWDHDVVVLDDTVFRFTKNRDYLHVLRKEMAVINWLKPQTKIPLPNYDYIAKEGNFGRYPLLPGRELRRHVLKSLTSAQRTRIAQELGEFLTLLHSIPKEMAQRWGIKEGTHTRNAYEKRQQQIRKVLFPRLTAGQRKWIDGQYERFMNLSWDFTPTVIHSDFTHHHIFVDPQKGQLSGIIDFADVEWDDPSRDFSGMWDYGQTFVETMLAAYQRPIDSDFIARSQFPHLYDPANDMLELLMNPNAHWGLSFEKSHALLQRKMKEYPLTKS